MPRKGRGGRRQGTPGRAYANRTDLQGTQAVRSAPSQEYGQRARIEAAQRALPLPRQSMPTQLFAPSERSDEPVTAGLSQGAGPGPEVLPMGQDMTVAKLRALYALHPDPDLRRILAAAEGTGDPTDAEPGRVPGPWILPRYLEESSMFSLTTDPWEEGSVMRIPPMRPPRFFPIETGEVEGDPWGAYRGSMSDGSMTRATNQWHADQGHAV